MGNRPQTPAKIILDAAHKWLEIDDDVYPVAVLATALANWMYGQPVWLLIVAAASSGKSFFIQAYSDLSGVYPLSSLTSRTFASGLKSKKEDGSNSLLHWLSDQNKYLMMLKDFGTILSPPAHERNAILAQLREIYDGEYSAAFGTGERFNWKGKLGLIAGATSKVDDIHKLSTELGERFVQIRPISADEELVALRAALNKGREHQMKREMRAAHSQALYLAREAWKRNPKLPPYATQVVVTLARLVARARTPVSRNPYKGGYEVAETEVPARLAGVFEQLFRAAYVCYGEDLNLALNLIRRVAVDSIVPRRRHLLLAEISRAEWGLSPDGLDKILKCDSGSVRRYLEDLEAIGLVRKETPVKKAIYHPSELLKELAKGAFLEPLDGDQALEKLFDLYNNITYEEREKKREEEHIRRQG